MRFSLVLLLAVAALCSEPLITKEYIEYLKKHVSWEVEDYEKSIFRGWTVEDAKKFLGLVPSNVPNEYPEVEYGTLPVSVDWSHSVCDHGPRDQADCGSCWAFATAGMLSDRCCIGASDHGWLSPQELVSCDRGSLGCDGGYLTTPITYFKRNGGLVPEACFPYVAGDAACPSSCTNGSDWRAAHVCKCTASKSCTGTVGIQNCLLTGPVDIGFQVCTSFMVYKSGIYTCDCRNYLGSHAVVAMGYGTSPSCHYHVRNSWGTDWGQAGYFDIACNTCRISGGTICSGVAN